MAQEGKELDEGCPNDIVSVVRFHLRVHSIILMVDMHTYSFDIDRVYVHVILL